jgi:ABC-type nitrate/sulfonate/bicarbonate transport system permease component
VSEPVDKKPGETPAGAPVEPAAPPAPAITVAPLEVKANEPAAPLTPKVNTDDPKAAPTPALDPAPAPTPAPTDPVVAAKEAPVVAKEAPVVAPADEAPKRPGFFGRLKLRREPPRVQKLVLGVAAVGFVLLTWTILTSGQVERRIVPRGILPSPGETFASLHSLWFDRAIMRNLITSLWRVIKGFGLAAVVGVPLGLLAGTFPRFGAFIAPVSLFGRNVPISALIPLTLAWFGISEGQKIAFLFVATAMFVLFDSSRAIAGVHERYVQTALTLGASPLQVVRKVLIPLALPDIFGSLRLLFGLAFGYIILAEINDLGGGGVGALIQISERLGPKEHVYLALFFITIVAFLIDRLLLTLQNWLFPWKESA